MVFTILLKPGQVLMQLVNLLYYIYLFSKEQFQKLLVKYLILILLITISNRVNWLSF